MGMELNFSQMENKALRLRKKSKEPQQVLGEKYRNFYETLKIIVKCKMRKQMGQRVK